MCMRRYTQLINKKKMLVFLMIDLLRVVSKRKEGGGCTVYNNTVLNTFSRVPLFERESFFCRRQWECVYLHNTGFAMQFFHCFLSQSFNHCSNLIKEWLNIVVCFIHCSPSSSKESLFSLNNASLLYNELIQSDS